MGRSSGSRRTVTPRSIHCTLFPCLSFRVFTCLELVLLVTRRKRLCFTSLLERYCSYRFVEEHFIRVDVLDATTLQLVADSAPLIEESQRIIRQKVMLSVEMQSKYLSRVGSVVNKIVRIMEIMEIEEIFSLNFYIL